MMLIRGVIFSLLMMLGVIGMFLFGYGVAGLLALWVGR